MLSLHAYQCNSLVNVDRLEETLRDFNPHVCLIDIQTAAYNNFALLQRIKKECSSCACIMLSNYEQVELAVQALQKGAYDYIRRPVSGEELRVILGRCFDQLVLKHESLCTETTLLEQKKQSEARIRELNCLFAISSLLNVPGYSLSKIFTKTVEILNKAFQSSSRCFVTIKVHDDVYLSHEAQAIYSDINAAEQHAKICKQIKAYDVSVGKICICCDETKHSNIGYVFLAEEDQLLTAVAELIGRIVERKKAESALNDSINRLQTAMDGIMQAMIMTTEMRDPFTAGHQRRVSKLATEIARGLKMTREEIEAIRLASMIHDLGKIYVPAEILSKPGIINPVEFNIIKAHSQVGYDILKQIDFALPIADIVYQHHERLDGSGYPLGLKAGAIKREARILSVADTVEAMASHRPYRPALGVNRALEEVERNRGTLYDTDVVNTCLELFREKNFSFD